MKLPDKDFIRYSAIMTSVAAVGLFLNPALYFIGIHSYFSPYNIPTFAIEITAYLIGTLIAFKKMANTKWIHATFTAWTMSFITTMLAEAIWISNKEHDGFTALFVLSGIFWQLIFGIVPLAIGVWFYRRYPK